MLVIRFASDNDVIDDALSLWNAAEELIHYSLPHSRCGCNTECKSDQPVESLVNFQSEERPWIHRPSPSANRHSWVPVNIREMLAATERGEDIVDARQWILVHFELRIDCHFEVSTDAD